MSQHDRARDLRKSATDAERLLWRHLRHKQLGGHRFRRQVPIGSYIVDFACHEQRLIIEVDGSQHAAQVAYDQARTSWLNSRGYRVLRFWNDDVMRDTDAVLEAIAVALPPPQPSPARGEGKMTQ